ncbi:IQ and AAA domain-containing protein 1-like [Portunus trituberculatus]|uniref:IQ and AAA domain-containing protein 1-like n=1 Tax=Portunus trituberculatus TaxID=210409 RepID=A0A5B7FW94_PORTR|nr:IQ and AAA domain-containing protein 1-like [Portunus trituberculatus]
MYTADVWILRQPEENPEERAEEDMIEAEQRARVEIEIRKQVDYLMRQEIQQLKEDVEGEKRGTKKKKRVKKGGKKGRKRKEKDLTPDRTTESLFEELVLNGVTDMNLEKELFLCKRGSRPRATKNIKKAYLIVSPLTTGHPLQAELHLRLTCAVAAAGSEGDVTLSDCMLNVESVASVTSPSELAAVAAQIKLPTFSEIDAPTWFRRAEVQFHMKRITNSTTQADHFLVSLPDEVFPCISEWLISKGDTATEYGDLKTFLL